MPQSSLSWWDRWFKRQPRPRPQGRQTRPNRQARRVSTPASSAGRPGQTSARQRPAPPAASCPEIVIQSASSGESHSQDCSNDFGTPGSSGTTHPTPRPVDVGPSDGESSGVGRSDEKPSDMEPGGASPSESVAPAADEADMVAKAHSQQPEKQVPLADMSASATSGGLIEADRAILRSELAAETPETAWDPQEGGPGSAPTFAGDDKMKTEIAQSRTAIQSVSNFDYETKEKKKISELAAEGQKLLELWQDALNKKGVLERVIRECTDAANQSGARLARDVQELEELYGELAEALANLQRTTSRRMAVKKDIKVMTKVVGNASAKEQAEVSKVAAVHEKEVYSKWQSLKGLAPDVEALEKLRKELAEKQRAISGLDALAQRRLTQLLRTEASPPEGIATGSLAKAIRQRLPPPAGRRAGAAARTIGKRRLSDEARHERRAAAGGQRGPGPPAVTAGTQAGPLPAPAPGPPPAPVSVFAGPVSVGPDTAAAAAAAGPLAHLLQAASAAADESGADEASTSNDEDGVTPLEAAFPLQFSPALFDSLDPAEAARAMADAMNFN